MMTMTRVVLFVCLLLWGKAVAHANLILNGDFETNSAAGSNFNLANVDFNALFANGTAFGTSEELDLVTANDFGIAPKNGKWKVGLHQKSSVPGSFDGFSLELASNVVTGTLYHLHFFAAGHPDFPLAGLQIGLSNNPSDFGTILFSGLPTSASAWSQFEYFDFTALMDAAFLTVRNDPAYFDGYVFVDDLSLVTTVPEPSTLLLIGSALIGFWVLRGRRNRRAGNLSILHR
jgi:hypothetical protein